MTISVTKTIQVNEKLNLNELKVYKGSSRDVDSVNIEVFYGEELIAEGHFNNKTNFAHFTITEGLMNEEDECDLMDYLVDGLEERTIVLK